MNSNKWSTMWKRNKRAYITMIAGAFGIAALVYTGTVANQSEEIPAQPTPTQGVYVIPTSPNNVVDNRPTAQATHTPMPTRVPTATTAPQVDNDPQPTRPPVTQAVENDNEAERVDGETDGSDSQTVSAEVLAGLSFEEDHGLNWPVLGEVVLRYSMDHGIFHETLQQFRTNDGVLIGAEKGANVVAAADGVVTDIREDTMRGLCVTVAIGSGYEVVYGQLAETSRSIGDVLQEGDPIGTVASPTKYYSVEGAHVYFKVLKDGETVNPLLLLRTLGIETE